MRNDRHGGGSGEHQTEGQESDGPDVRLELA